MSDTDKVEPRTHCIMCGHPTPAHPEDEKGMRPCRSVNHPAGLNCTECTRLLDKEALAAMQERRGQVYADQDGPEARAWAAFHIVRAWAQYVFGPSWQAFYTDIHQSALAAALIEYDKALKESA
jgi:hypothetical protein